MHGEKKTFKNLERQRIWSSELELDLIEPLTIYYLEAQIYVVLELNWGIRKVKKFQKKKK